MSKQRISIAYAIIAMSMVPIYGSYDLVKYEQDNLYGQSLFDSSPFFLDAVVARNDLELMKSQENERKIEQFLAIHEDIVIPVLARKCLCLEDWSIQEINQMYEVDLGKVKQLLEDNTDLSFEHISMLVESFRYLRQEVSKARENQEIFDEYLFDGTDESFDNSEVQGSGVQQESRSLFRQHMDRLRTICIELLGCFWKV